MARSYGYRRAAGWKKMHWGTQEQEQWASKFYCPSHGKCTYEMVSTKKTCMVPLAHGGSICDQGLLVREVTAVG